jgi:hypothetical protein
MNGLPRHLPGPGKKNRTAPFVFFLAACGVAVVAAAVWMHMRRPAPEHAAAKAPVDAKPIVTSPPAVVRSAADLPPAASIPPSTLEDKWGIQFRSIALTRGNTAVELFYTIVASEKAALLGQGDSTAYLVDLDSGRRIALDSPPQQAASLSPHSRARSAALMLRDAGGFPPPPSRLVPGKTYSILLRNEGGLLKRGSRVVVTVGNQDCSTDVFTLK